MNANNTWVPLTELRRCQEIKVKEMIKQGSVLGAVISAITIDSLTRIIDKYGKSWDIGGSKMNPLIFQDDICAANRTEDIQKTVKIIETFQHLKRLQFHKDKTKKSILMGKNDEPIYINGKEIMRAQNHMYLGKIIAEKGKHKEDIKERLKKAIAVSTQSIKLVQEKRLNNKRIEVGIKLLQTVVIPTFISGAETWPQLTKEETSDMNNVQTSYLAQLLEVPRTTPKCGLIKETGLMKISHVVNLRKIEFYIDMYNREENRLEVQMRIHQENKNMTYEKEIEELKKIYNIKENLKNVEAKEGKKKVRKYIMKKNDEVKNGTKTKDLDICNKNYMNKLNFKEAKMIFLLKTNMLETKGTFKGKYPKNLKCEVCEKKEETTQHLFECEGYTEIRRNIVVKNTPMETLKENSMSAIARVLERIKEKS